MANDDDRVHRQETDSGSTKGTQSVQQYLSATVRTVTSSPASMAEGGTQNSEETSTKSSTNGDVRETRTSNGVGKTQTQTEDKGVKLKFRIQFQNRNPVLRV